LNECFSANLVSDHFNSKKTKLLEDTIHQIEDFVNFLTDTKIDKGYRLDDYFNEPTKKEWLNFKKEILFENVQESQSMLAYLMSLILTTAQMTKPDIQGRP
jgi:hypothetical protein